MKGMGGSRAPQSNPRRAAGGGEPTGAPKSCRWGRSVGQGDQGGWGTPYISNNRDCNSNSSKYTYAPNTTLTDIILLNPHHSPELNTIIIPLQSRSKET